MNHAWRRPLLLASLALPHLSTAIVIRFDTAPENHSIIVNSQKIGPCVGAGDFTAAPNTMLGVRPVSTGGQ
jgi:hypothetical protein